LIELFERPRRLYRSPARGRRPVRVDLRSLARLRDLEPVDHLRRDLRELQPGEEWQQVELERPAQVDKRFRREPLELPAGEPLRRELVEARFRRRCRLWFRSGGPPDAAANVGEHEAWAPAAVEGFLQLARHERQAARGVWTRTTPLPTSTVGCTFTPCYRLNLPCALKADANGALRRSRNVALAVACRCSRRHCAGFCC